MIARTLTLGTALAVLTAAPAAAQNGSSDRSAEKDIVETAMSAGSFETLVAAVKAAGLVETLRGDGPFTVFAPNDAAFEKLPEGTLNELLKPESREKLTAILTYHVVPGRLTASEVVSRDDARTVQGQKVSFRVKNGTAYVDGAKILATDIETSNGVIHVIDSVILPSEKKDKYSYR